MRANNQQGKAILAVFILVVLLAAVWAVWEFGFCRFYVGPGQMAIITAKTGAALAPGQILAKPGQKGVLEDVLGEGRYFLNPYLYEWTIADAFTIPPGNIGVVTSKIGEDLPPEEFLAEDHQKGIRKKVLGPGRYRLNPVAYDVAITDIMSIPVGFAGVVTSLSGENAAEGTFAQPGQKGVRQDVLHPGFYYVNPREFEVAVVEVGVNQVSLTGQTGGMVLTKNIATDENNQMMQRLNRNVLEDQKRRRDEYLQQQAPVAAQAPVAMSRPAVSAEEDYADYAESRSELSSIRGKLKDQERAYGMNKRGVVKVPPTKSNEGVSGFLLNQVLNFPSRDGFDITLDMTVEFELRPEKLAAIYRDYGDLPKVVDKIIMPQILSVSRLKGSAYRAIDFVAGEGREKFQNDLTDTLKSMLAEKNLLVHSALIRNVNVPMQILEPLRVTSLSRETDLTNREKQNTARKQAELNTEMSLINQYGQQVIQETTKMKAEIKAQQDKTVAQIQAGTLRRVAEIEKTIAAQRSERTISLGQAKADSLRMVEEEKAKGFGMRVKSFGEDGNEYALYEFAMNLNPDVRINILHSGEGTLWTDMAKAGFSELGGATTLKKK